MKGLLHQLNIGNGGVPKHAVETAYVTKARVFGDDWNWGPGKTDEKGRPGEHGGPEKAVCLYSTENLEVLQRQGFNVSPGSLAENLTTTGIDYHDIRIGDVLTVGTEVMIRIRKIRTPCKKIEVYGTGIGKAMMNKQVKRCDYEDPLWGMTGFYAEVLQEGTVQQGMTIERIAEGDPDIPLGTWKHFKGGEYKVVNVAPDTETGEQRVWYHPKEKPHEPQDRPRDMFLETVEGKGVPRFTFIG